MFRFRKNQITINVEKVYNFDIQHFIDEDVKTYGVSEVKAFHERTLHTFVTKLKVDEVAKLLEEKLYKCNTTVLGNIIVVKFY
jgi:hypothetical protein